MIFPIKTTLLLLIAKIIHAQHYLKVPSIVKEERDPCLKSSEILKMSPFEDYIKTNTFIEVDMLEKVHNLKVKLLRGTRSFWYCKQLNTFGEYDEGRGNVNVPLRKEDLLEMEKTSKCHVGGDCKPNQCWGSDAHSCSNKELTEYREFSTSFPVESCWQKALYRTCTRLWHCTLNIEDELATLDLLGRKMFYLEGQRILEEEDEIILKDSSYHVKIIDKSIKINRMKTSCLRFSDEIYCKNADNPNNLRYDRYKLNEEGELCNVYSERIRCLKNIPKSLEIRTEIELYSHMKPNELNFLNIFELIETNQRLNNRNSIILEEKIYNIKEVINAIIFTLMDKHPEIVSRVTKNNVYAKALVFPYIKVYKCSKQNEDMLRAKSLIEVASNKDIKKIDLMKSPNEIEEFMTEHFKYIDETNIIERDRVMDEVDRSQSNEKEYEPNSNMKGFGEDVSLNTFNYILTHLSIINLILILSIIFFRR